MSADNGCPEAQFYYAVILAKGDEIKKDLRQANRYLKRAADQGLTRAQSFYAIHLWHGLGIAQNREEASKYWRMAAACFGTPAISSVVQEDLSKVAIDAGAERSSCGRGIRNGEQQSAGEVQG
jgi:TPR repeat protein